MGPPGDRNVAKLIKLRAAEGDLIERLWHIIPSAPRRDPATATASLGRFDPKDENFDRHCTTSSWVARRQFTLTGCSSMTAILASVHQHPDGCCTHVLSAVMLSYR
jgi:hypothetical protein